MNERARSEAVAHSLENSAFFMPFSANRQFKKAPRLFARAGLARILSERPDVVVCDYAWPAGYAAPRLRAAGVPCVICPFFGDQPGWARLSVELGVGVAPVPRGEMDTTRALLREGLRQIEVVSAVVVGDARQEAGGNLNHPAAGSW